MSNHWWDKKTLHFKHGHRDISVICSHFAVFQSAPGGDCDTLLLPVYSSPFLFCVSPFPLGVALIGPDKWKSQNTIFTPQYKLIALWGKSFPNISNVDMLGFHNRQHDTKETLPPSVCTESSQSRQLNGFVTSEPLCLCNTLSLTSSNALLNNCCWSNFSRPFWVMSHTQTLAVTQVWVIENDLPQWVTWQSTSCATILQVQEQNWDRDRCQHVCVMKPEIKSPG